MLIVIKYRTSRFFLFRTTVAWRITLRESWFYFRYFIYISSTYRCTCFIKISPGRLSRFLVDLKKWKVKHFRYQKITHELIIPREVLILKKVSNYTRTRISKLIHDWYHCMVFQTRRGIKILLKSSLKEFTSDVVTFILHKTFRLQKLSLSNIYT